MGDFPTNCTPTLDLFCGAATSTSELVENLAAAFPIGDFLSLDVNRRTMQQRQVGATLLDLQVDESCAATSLEAGTYLKGTVRLEIFSSIETNATILQLLLGDDDDCNKNAKIISLDIRLEAFENTEVVVTAGEHSRAMKEREKILSETLNLLDQVREIVSRSDGLSLDSEKAIIPFEFELPEDIPGSMPRYSTTNVLGYCGVSYEISVFLVLEQIDAGLMEKTSGAWSKPLPLSIHSKRKPCTPTIEFIVGPLQTTSAVEICGLCAIAYRESFSLIPSTFGSTIHIHPGQGLKIYLWDDATSNDSSGTTSWRRRVVRTTWKLTQKTTWWTKNRKVDSSCDYQNWEETLNQATEGTVQIPSQKNQRMTYEGKLIEVCHEMIIFCTDEASNIIATSPQIPVVLGPGI